MPEWLSTTLSWIGGNEVASFIRAIVILAAGLFVSKLSVRLCNRLISPHLSGHHAILTTRAVYYLVLGLFVVSALRELGFSLSVLLGAAGILTVAIGFASQTSASNLISGLFLLAERPFSVGDVITIGGRTGEVLSIDLLSVKMRTFDNLYVRIPNESVIKGEVVTLTRFPIRRHDIKVGIAYKEDIARARDVLFDVADKNYLCLDEPKPLFIFQGYGESSLDIQFSVWAARENFLELRNSIYEEIKIAFDNAGIEIPFPHRSIYAGSVTDPFPVRVVEGH